MRVEVDVSDLTELAYYIDKRCKDLEGVLKTDSKYAEYVVKRQHYGEDWQLDPYVIQNPQGEDLVTLETWEVDTLDESELVSYTDVQMNRNKHDSSSSGTVFGIIFIILGPFAIAFSVTPLFLSFMSSIMIAIALFLDFVILLSGANFYKKRKDNASRKRQIDLVAAREDLTFLNALRKLASLSSQENWKREEYVKRLGYIEDDFTGVIS